MQGRATLGSMVSGSRVGYELSDIVLWVLCFVAIDSVLDLVTEMPDETLNGPSCCITQGADSVTFNLEREFLEHVNFGEISIALLQTSE